MRYVYVILSATPTKMGAIIRKLTGKPVNHASISLKEDWSEMYSFARYRFSNPWVGGFVREYPKRLSLGEDRKVYIEVFKIPVCHEQYEKISLFINKIQHDNEKNIYNSIAALGLLFHWEFKAYKTFTCSDFVIEVLRAGNVLLENYSSKNIMPYELRKIFSKYTFFKGYLSEFSIALTNVDHDEEFFKKTGTVENFFDIIRHFRSLYNRRLIMNNSSMKK